MDPSWTARRTNAGQNCTVDGIKWTVGLSYADPLKLQDHEPISNDQMSSSVRLLERSSLFRTHLRLRAHHLDNFPTPRAFTALAISEQD